MALVSLGVGSLVWVEDPDDAWIDGEVVGINGEDIKVLCASGMTVRIQYWIYVSNLAYMHASNCYLD